LTYFARQGYVKQNISGRHIAVHDAHRRQIPEPVGNVGDPRKPKHGGGDIPLLDCVAEI
jgi:hypothetical protein